jgi:hypothetical protein
VEAEEALLAVVEEVVPEVAAALGVVVVAVAAAEEVSRRIRYAICRRDSHEPASLWLRMEETTVSAAAAAAASKTGDESQHASYDRIRKPHSESAKWLPKVVRFCRGSNSLCTATSVDLIARLALFTPIRKHADGPNENTENHSSNSPIFVYMIVGYDARIQISRGQTSLDIGPG